MRRLPTVGCVVLFASFLAAGCGKEDTGEANLPKPMPESEVQKLTPEQQENVRKFQELQKQNSQGGLR